jgi:hypothetical protein
VTTTIVLVPRRYTSKNSVHTSHKMQHVSVIETILSVQFKETIAVYSENHMKPINTLCGQNVRISDVKAGGTYRHHGAQKC